MWQSSLKCCINIDDLYSNDFVINLPLWETCRTQTDGESQPLLQQNHQQQQQQMVPLQDSYMQSRAEALQNVESTIHELGNIFNQLATLVSQQGEIAIRFKLQFLLAHWSLYHYHFHFILVAQAWLLLCGSYKRILIIGQTIGDLPSQTFTFDSSFVFWSGCSCRIDENMDDTLSNVEGAQGALLKYLNSISSNRWLMIKIFFVLIFFLMVFLFFVA